MDIHVDYRQLCWKAKLTQRLRTFKSLQKQCYEWLLILVIFCLDPTHVMGLYPDLLPTDYRKQLQYPNPLPGLSGAELEKAHLALIDYLTQVSAPISFFRAVLLSFSIRCWSALTYRKQYAYSSSFMLALMGFLNGWKL